MEGENIDLAKFNFNVDDVVKGAAVIKKTIDELKQEQKKLTKEGKTSSIRYVENAAALKTLNNEYNKHIKALSASQKQTQEAALREKKLDLVINQEVTTIKQAREQNKLLNQLRNETNLTTEEGRLQLERLNAKLDANNELIKDNSDAYAKQKINIGNYKDSIKEAFNEMNIFSDGLGGVAQNFGVFISKSREAGGVGNLLKGSLTGASQGLLGLAKAGVAFIATPIGAVIAALVASFLLIKNAMERNEESLNKLKKAFSPFQGILNKVMQLLEPLGDILIEGLVNGFELLEQSIYKAIDGLSKILDFLGFEEAANTVRDYNKELIKGAQNAKDLSDAEAELVKEQRKARLIQLQYQKDAEKQRQIRDDESRSMSERIQANKELGLILEQQLHDELKIAQQALLVANLRIQAEGKTSSALDEQAAALENIADIEERINGQRSEQLVNENSLRKEAADKAAEAAQKKIDAMNEELELFIAQQGIKAKTLEEELKLEKETSKRKVEILNAELKAKKISETAYQTEILNLKNEAAMRQAEIVSKNALKEIEELRTLNAKKQSEEGFLTEALTQQRIEYNNNLLVEEQEYQALRLEQGLINQDEYNKAINELNEANRVANEEIEKERKAVENKEAIELRAIEFEEELARMQEEGATKFEIEKAQQDEQAAILREKALADKEAGLISEELYQARINQIKNNAAHADLEREKILRAEKLDLTAGLLSQLSGLIDKQSAAGKSIAIAQAGINTFQGITEGLKAPFPLNIALPIVAGATGFAAVKKIVKTKVPSAKGGGSSGSSTTANSTVSTGVGGVNLQGKGVNLSHIAGSGNTAVQNQIQQTASSQNIAQEVGRAAEEGTRRGSQQGSQQGMIELSDNRNIQQKSSF